MRCCSPGSPRRTDPAPWHRCRTSAASTTTALLVLVIVLIGAACSGAAEPELVGVEPTATPAPTATPLPTPTPVPTATPVPEPTATPTPVIPERRRGVSDTTIRIGVITTGQVFGDVELGVLARLRRAAADGGVAGRTIEIAEVIDDEGDPAATLAAARRLVQDEGVFAVVLTSAVPSPAVTDYLAARGVPFFGWGFSSGFCEPNEWGFGFSGCLPGSVLGVPDARVDVSRREVLDMHLGTRASVVLVTGEGPAGDAAAAEAAAVWRGRLLDVVRLAADARNPYRPIERSIDTHDPDALLLSLDLGRTLALKDDLITIFDGPVVDDVTYQPGLLADIPIALRLEGGFAFSPIPPQEEYRDATGVVTTDVDRAGGPLVYSRAVSVGYWSADLMVSLFTAVGRELDARTFHRTVVVDGVRYDPGLDGAPCPMDSRRMRRQPAGGVALVTVAGGIYRPAVSFSCHRPE